MPENPENRTLGIIAGSGGTSRIGDPSFRDDARQLLTDAQIAENLVKAAVLTVFKENGDPVKKGQLLVQLDDTSIRDTLSSARTAADAASQAGRQLGHDRTDDRGVCSELQRRHQVGERGR